MKFYVRELPQKQYHYLASEICLPKNKTPKPGDTFHDHRTDYHIDRVTYSKNGLIVYATKTGLHKYKTILVIGRRKINLNRE